MSLSGVGKVGGEDLGHVLNSGAAMSKWDWDGRGRGSLVLRLC